VPRLAQLNSSGFTTRSQSGNAQRGGIFSSGAHFLFRLFVLAGCAEAKVGSAIQALLDEVGVIVRHLPSVRTVQRAIKEGGEFGLIQLGYEILQGESEYFFVCGYFHLLTAAGFGLSTDSTSHRGITLEGTTSPSRCQQWPLGWLNSE
jgi:hypothetical protein